MARYENRSDVVLLENFPPIYPLIEKCDLYIGDYSSIGYDFLALDKPLYFLNPSSSPLRSCGLELPNRGAHQFLIDTLEANTKDYSTQRKNIYYYAFGEALETNKIKSNIFTKLHL